MCMNLKRIGENIKKLRTEQGMTQSQLAELAGISNVHMSHIETGTVAMSLDSLINITNSLKTTPDSILLGEYQLSPAGTTELLQQSIKKLSSDENRLLIEIARVLENLKINR